MRLLLAVAVAVLSFTATAQAQQPACGDVLTHSVTLRSDLVCAPGQTALTIGADDIVLDLGGHAIRNSSLAVDGRGGFDGVIVRGGDLVDNRLGIRLADVTDGRVAHLTISGGLEGVSATGGAGLRIRDVDACANFFAIVLNGGTGALVRRVRACGADDGVSIAGAEDVTIEDSLFVGNFHNGVRITGSDDVVVRDSEATGNHRVGFFVSGGSTGTRLIENVARHNARGIQVDAGATGTRLRGNVASVNDFPPSPPDFQNDGIDVFEPSTVLADNVARRNPGFGINAPDGAVDAGGNRASGNGAGDCVNVDC
jgi:nitrous oxidase accessory protein NosD